MAATSLARSKNTLGALRPIVLGMALLLPPANDTLADEAADASAPQGDREAPEASPTRSSARVIEEIVVTAQKTSQSLQDVPISVSAISGEQAREAAITETQDLVQYTPNIKFSQSFGATPSINIRGFGSPPLARGIEPSVGLVIDDVFYGRSSFTNDGVFDLERLEVLRGPQGTLFGKNTVAGVLNFTTAPATFKPEGYALVGAGTLDERHVEAGAGFPLIDDVLAARLSFRYRDTETGQINTAQGDEKETVKDIAGRIKLEWRVTDSLEANVLAFLTGQEAEGIGFQYQKADPGTLSVFREFDPRADADVFNERLSSNAPTFFERNSTSVAGKIVQRVDRLAFVEGLEVTLIGNWARIGSPFRLDNDYSPIPWVSLETLGPEVYEQHTGELRLTGMTPAPFAFGDSMDWVAGVFYFDSSFEVSQLARLNIAYLDDFIRAGGITGRPTSSPCTVLPAELCTVPSPPDRIERVTNLLESDGRSIAGFAQSTWHLPYRLSVLLGIRVGREEKSAFQSSQSTNGVVSGLAGQRDFTNRGSLEESEVSPKVAVAWELDDGVNVFANVARGFKSGGFSGPLVAPTNTQFASEKALSFELGVKSRLFERTLMVNATAYRVEFDNLQLNLFDGVNISTVNAAAAEAWGAEMDFQWLPPLEFLTLAGSAGFTKAQYGDFPCGPAKISDSNLDNPASCPQPSTPRSPAFQDLTGKTLPFAPKVSASFSPSVRLPLFPSLGIGALLGVDVLYQGRHYLDPDLDVNALQPATTKINARIGIRPVDGPWAVILNGKNLTGQQERLLVLDTPQLPGSFVAIPKYDEPTVTIELRYTF